jgi:hypothetical protein
MKNQIRLYSNLQTIIHTNGSVSMGLHLGHEGHNIHITLSKNLCTQMTWNPKIGYPIHALYFKTFNMKKYKVADIDVYSNKLWNGGRQKSGEFTVTPDLVLFKFKKRYALY